MIGGFQVGPFQLAFQQAVAAQGPTAAGRSRKRRYYVEIDGQQFPVESAEEARQLLQQARAIAERQAEQKGEKATRQLRRKKVVPKVRIEPPNITASPEIRADLVPVIDDIKRLYVKAAELAELRLLMLRRIREEDDDDEDDLLLLL